MAAIKRETARDVLSNLLSKLSDPPWGFHYQGYPRYQGLFHVDGILKTPRRPGRDIVAIRDLLFSSMCDEVFEIFAEPNLKPNQEM